MFLLLTPNVSHGYHPLHRTKTVRTVYNNDHCGASWKLGRHLYEKTDKNRCRTIESWSNPLNNWHKDWLAGLVGVKGDHTALERTFVIRRWCAASLGKRRSIHADPLAFYKRKLDMDFVTGNYIFCLKDYNRMF
jgi:hypothetical protein